MSEGPYGRTSFEFDTIDVDITDAAGPQLRELFQGGETKPFALLRIVTTATRFLEFAGDVPMLGDWFFLEIEPQGQRPGLMTWHAQLGLAGYSSHSRGLTVRARRLTSEVTNLGARVASERRSPHE